MNKNFDYLTSELWKILNSVSKPGRYVGGEYGSVIKEDEALSVLISYPDLYEIGMSNMAIHILYDMLNKIEGVSCERVFAPDRDLEEILKSKNLPLFSLEKGRPINTFDVIGFTIGYELTLSSLLNILDTGQIPYYRKERRESDPIIIAGGPAVTNPYPLSPFIDFVFIGESEDFITSTFPVLVQMKKNGASKSDLSHEIAKHPSVWFAGREKTVKSIYNSFPVKTSFTGYPV